jgi:hypothetical protein
MGTSLPKFFLAASFALLAPAVVAGADDLKKAQMLDEILNSPGIAEGLMKSIRLEAGNLACGQGRSLRGIQSRVTTGLAALVSEEEIRNHYRLFLGKNLNEAELTRLLVLQKTSWYPKLTRLLPSTHLRQFAERVLEERYEQVTHHSLAQQPPPAPPPPPRPPGPPPSWLTRMIWKLYPASNPCGPGGPQ